MNRTVAITGAFSYTGKYATRILLDRGYDVRTLTGHAPSEDQNPHPPATNAGRVGHPRGMDPFLGAVRAFPYNFDRPKELQRSLEGLSTLINTYWVRFPHGKETFDTAVRNSRTLIAAARDAGVRRIVHVSIANPSLESRLGYYRGKALVEEAVRESGMSYSILRPTVIFGAEDMLINNIAWFLRRFPVFGIPVDGKYGIRPIYVEDMAQLLVSAAERERNEIVDAVGPETFAFEEMVRMIAAKLGRRIRIVRMPAGLAYLSTLVTGWVVGDVVLDLGGVPGADGQLAGSGWAECGSDSVE